jgi:N-acetylmuramate 1-kinase
VNLDKMKHEFLPAGTHEFLTRLDWGQSEIRPLAGDASFRAYFRILKAGASSVLMVAPPAKEAIEPFVAVGKFLESLGLSVPHIIGVDSHLGLALLEDLGDSLFPVALAKGADEFQLYAGAIEVLAIVHEQECPKFLPGFELHHELPMFTADRLQDEVDRVLEWHWEALHGTKVSGEVHAQYHRAWAPLWEKLACDPLVLTQFDYHSPNLMWLPDRQDLRQIGVLDFQDALQGPAAYDVVSLLQDARRDLATGLEVQMKSLYIESRSDLNQTQFETAYAILGAQRAARILGTFVRLWKRDGKPGYLQHQPRVWQYLDRNLIHPDLQEVKDWFDRYVPPEMRGTYWTTAA